jgi:hypothetical protein
MPNIRRLALFGILACLACGASSNGAPASPSSPQTPLTRATTLPSFEGLEEPEVLYHPSSSRFTPDDFVNMTNPSPGLFRFVLRFHPADDWWDGDRTTTNDDRQRAEVKGLGAHQKTGDAFEYSTTWRTTRGGSGTFWHVFQLKATDGDNDPPLVVLSIQSGNNAAVRYWPGTSSNFLVARPLTYTIGEWTTVRIRIKTSTSSSASGYVLASVNGDPFVGVTNVPVFRPSSTDYRPKWGSYRGVDPSQPYGDDTVEHREISAQKIAPI